MSIIGPTSYSHQFPNYQLGDLTQAMDYNEAGQTIDVRAYSELGIQTVGPRMSFVYTPILM